MSVLSDLERLEFLIDLDESDLDVTDWEAKFIKTQVEKYLEDLDDLNYNQRLFSDPQRLVIGRMMDSYMERL